MGKMFDPSYAFANAIRVFVEVTAPCMILLTLLPVILFGRDVPRLLAIGLSVLPAYVAVAGFGDAWSLWVNGR